MDYNSIELITVTELPEYIRRANALLSIEERKAVIDYIAAFPLAGDVIKQGRNTLSKLVKLLAQKPLLQNSVGGRQ